MRGVIGYPLGHSCSKIIHEYINKKNYQTIELSEDDFHVFMRDRNFKCINVTIPYKQMVMPYLDEVDVLAKRIDAVNCIVNDGGRLIGYNSDYHGFLWMIEKYQIDIKNKVVLILGNGGASKAVSVVIDDLKAKKVYIADRNHVDGTIGFDEIYHVQPQVLINTTPVGMYPDNDGCIVDLERFTRLESVVDIVYNPLNTRLVIEAKKRGIKACAGLYMLVAQAVKGVEYFDHNVLDRKIVDVCFNKIEHMKRNIVLIGMPDSGKSTIGKLLSEKLNMEFIDSDQLIIEEINMSIKDFFEIHGEEAFRDIENSVIRQLRNKHNAIISTGGGVILNDDNMRYLKENGHIYFIDRDVDMLCANDERPLANTLSKIKDLYHQRYSLYCQYSDITIKNDGVEDAVNKIVEWERN